MFINPQHCAALSCLVVVGISALVCAEEPTRNVPADPHELVARLGDESFAVRESAASDLRKQGLAAKEALETGAKEADLEIRLRCQELLSTAMRQDLEARLAAFIADAEGKLAHNLPGWKQFRKRCGSDRPAREFFAELLRQEAPLLKTLDAPPEQLTQIFAERVIGLQKVYYSGSRERISAASVAALLLVGSEPEVAVDAESGYAMYYFLVQANAVKALSEGPQAETMRVLLEAWVSRGASDSLSYYNLQLALTHNLKNPGLALGRKILAVPRASMNSVQYALIAVGKFGDKSDLPALEPWLKDSRLCNSWSNPQFRNLIKTEIRDVALVMLLRLSGQEPKDYGFNLLQENPMTVYQIYSFGFSEPADREAALTKWSVWSMAQKK